MAGKGFADARAALFDVEDGASIQTLTRYRYNQRPPVAAGAIRLDVGSLDLLSGGQVVSLSGGVEGIPDPGAAGDIDIEVVGELRIEGVKQAGSLTQRSGIISRALAEATSEAAGGNIHVHAGNLVMAESASISGSTRSAARSARTSILAPIPKWLFFPLPVDKPTSCIFR